MVVAAIATLIPMLIYLWAGFSKRSTARTEDDYFLGGREVSADDYANTSVGYALQMAAVFLFAAWGILYGIGALWTAVFWAVGYWVLWHAIPYFEEYRKNHGEATLHGFLRARYGAGRSLQVVAAVATILGLIGTMVAEVDYTVAVYSPVTGAVDPMYFEAFFFTAGVLYIIWNGYKAEVVTERFQVPLAYSGILVTLLSLLPAVWTFSGPKPFWWCAGVLFIALTLILVAKLRFDRQRGTTGRQTLIPVIALLVLVAETIWIVSSMAPGVAQTMLDKPWSEQLMAQGKMGLLSLLLANGLWMIVDVSTWQRVAAVKGADGLATTAIRQATARVMLESPASWCLGAVLGWSIRASGIIGPDADPFAAIGAFSDALATGAVATPLGMKWSYGIWVASCVAIMLSTISAFLSAISFTADRDLRRGDDENLRRARITTIAVVIIGVLLYESLRRAVGGNLSTLLYGAYSAQLSLVVVVALALIGRRRSARAALASICLGLAGALGATLTAIQPGLPPETAASLGVLPPVFAILGALAGYLLFNQQAGLRSKEPLA